MDRRDWQRLKGLGRLLHDGVERGADFVEKHHRHAAEKPFQTLEAFSVISAPVRVVRGVHDGVLAVSYGGIRALNRAAGVTSGWVVDLLEPTDEGDEREPTSR